MQKGERVTLARRFWWKIFLRCAASLRGVIPNAKGMPCSNGWCQKQHLPTAKSIRRGICLNEIREKEPVVSGRDTKLLQMQKWSCIQIAGVRSIALVCRIFHKRIKRVDQSCALGCYDRKLPWVTLIYDTMIFRMQAWDTRGRNRN